LLIKKFQYRVIWCQYTFNSLTSWWSKSVDKLWEVVIMARTRTPNPSLRSYVSASCLIHFKMRELPKVIIFVRVSANYYYPDWRCLIDFLQSRVKNFCHGWELSPHNLGSLFSGRSLWPLGHAVFIFYSMKGSLTTKSSQMMDITFVNRMVNVASNNLL